MPKLVLLLVALVGLGARLVGDRSERLGTLLEHLSALPEFEPGTVSPESAAHLLEGLPRRLGDLRESDR